MNLPQKVKPIKKPTIIGFLVNWHPAGEEAVKINRVTLQRDYEIFIFGALVITLLIPLFMEDLSA